MNFHPIVWVREKTKTGLDRRIEELEHELAITDPETKEYKRMCQSLQILYDTRETGKGRLVNSRVLPALITTAGSLALGYIVLRAERDENLILPTKPFSYGPKPRE